VASSIFSMSAARFRRMAWALFWSFQKPASLAI
jgi:hypothetical protein